MIDWHLSRRTLCGSAILAGLLSGTHGIARAADGDVGTGPVDTAHGKVAGLRRDGVSRFLGIRYGADTSTTRFLPPAPAPDWTGVSDCTAFGNSAPQGRLPNAGQANSEAARFLATLFGMPGEVPPPESEDCLFLNVWTPEASPRAKRPVMFWLHGGGFAQGNGSSAMYDGTALCQRGDVVVVTINHRLNAMGYLYLAGMDPVFADSGNVGQLDQVLALQWVRDNIAAFGGDPGNVTIFGESGGGSKVAALLAMPPAQGLFHKAIIQSGPMLRGVEAADAHALAEKTLADLGIAQGDVRKLQSIDYREIVQAALRSQPPRGIRSLAPVVDGRSLPAHPFDPVAPAISANVPVIVGSCKDEATLFTMPDPQFGKMTPEDVRQRFGSLFGSRADEAFALVSSRRPDDPPTYWYTTALTGSGTWIDSIKLAERKQAQGGAPAYMFRLDWHTPVMGGALRAPHGLDTGLVFDNADRSRGIVGPGREPELLAADMAQSWINFARSGDPSFGRLRWPQYDHPTRKTMIFDVPSHVTGDPDGDLRRFFA